jgi:two-component system, OmpR family, KDP operon response regulator KdpE
MMINKQTILVISEDCDLYKQLEDDLWMNGYQVCRAQSVDAGLKSLISRVHPDLIVIDPEVPSMKGLELSLLVRQWTPVPILILSIETEQKREVRILDLNAADYLSEPLDIKVVTARINNLLSLSPSGL